MFDLRHIRQRHTLCGVACLQMVTGRSFEEIERSSSEQRGEVLDQLDRFEARVEAQGLLGATPKC